MLDEVWKVVATSGPMAVVLGAGLAVLWAKLKAKEIYYEGDPNDPEKKPGLLAQRAKEAQVREDALRVHYEEKLKAERDENKALYRELNQTLKGLIGEEA